EPKVDIETELFTLGEDGAPDVLPRDRADRVLLHEPRTVGAREGDAARDDEIRAELLGDVLPEGRIAQDLFEGLLGEGGGLDVEDLELRALGELAADDAHELPTDVQGRLVRGDESRDEDL